MRRDAIFTASLALVQLSGCSVLFDPAQYSVPVDADGLDARMLEPLDAAIVMDVEASLDAWTPETPDASVDAVVPEDAGAIRCPGPTSLDLPTCLVRGNGLRYCDPVTGELREMLPAVADELLNPGRYELGLLGNANQVAEASRGGIVDIELAREGERVVAVWLDAATQDVHRRQYTVGSSGLTAGDVELASFGAVGSVGTDLSVRPGHVDDIAVGYRNESDQPRYGDCRAPAFGGACVSSPTTVSGIVTGRVLVAHADGAVVGLLPGRQGKGMPDGFFTEQVRPTPGAGTFWGAGETFGALRSTSGAFTYTEGAAGGIERVVTAQASTTLLGANRPRLVRNDAEDNDYRIVRARMPAGTELAVDSAYVSEGASGALECGAPPGSCMDFGTYAVERRVENAFPTLYDWTYDIVDRYYRIAVFLVGDSAGTQVAVAPWQVEMDAPGATITPIVIGSGRVMPSGNGRAIRTVVEHDANTVEVFVLTLVTQGEGASARDRLFLSGFRLLSCGAL